MGRVHGVDSVTVASSTESVTAREKLVPAITALSVKLSTMSISGALCLVRAL